MVDLTQLSDEDLGAALFDALVERLDARAFEDPSITVVNRMPTAFAVSRRGNLLTLSQGIGLRLLRGDLKWKDRSASPRTFHISRATIHPRLVITPDRFEGTPDDVLDRVVSMFLAWTSAKAARSEVEPPPQREQPARSGREAPETPRPSPTETPVVTRVPRDPLPVRDEAASPSTVVTSAPKHTGTTPPVTSGFPPASHGRETATRTLRTYQLLLETARRELEQAKALPVGSRYFLISAGVFVGLTAEAFFNDLGSRMIPSWSQLQRLDPREKAEVLNIELFNEKVDWSVSPFQSVAAALGFRRALAHAHTETLSVTQVTTARGSDEEVPRTRRTAWQEYCDVGTIQRWIADVGTVIELFSRTHDGT
jgi:hypothetical protein